MLNICDSSKIFLSLIRCILRFRMVLQLFYLFCRLLPERSLQSIDPTDVCQARAKRVTLPFPLMSANSAYPKISSKPLHHGGGLYSPKVRYRLPKSTLGLDSIFFHNTYGILYLATKSFWPGRITVLGVILLSRQSSSTVIPYF